MNRLLPFILSAFLLSFNLPAQTQVDSLRDVLITQADDTSKVNTYLYFFYTDLFYDDPAGVIDYLEQALSLSEKIEYREGIANAYSSLGYIYRIRSENDSALYYFTKAAEIAESIDFTVGVLDAYIGLGNTYKQLSKWQQAIEEYKKAETIAIEHNNLSVAASANNNMGNISLAQGALKEALNYYQKAADFGPASIKEVALVNIALVHIELGDPQKAKTYLLEAKVMTTASKNWYTKAFIEQQLGSMERNEGNLQEALAYYQQAMDAYLAIDEKYNYSEVLTSVASVYYDQQLYDKALSAYEESRQIQEEIEHFTGLCNSMHGIARVYLKTGELGACEAVLLEAVEIADKYELLTVKDDLTLTLSALYKEMGQFAQALKYHETYKLLSDSLLNQEKSKQISELETQFEIRQKQQEIDLLSAENQVANLQLEQQQNLRNYLIILAVILVLLVTVAYSRYQIKVKANNKLRELDSLKTNFFTNISHEFRTPLTLILSPLEKVLKRTNDEVNTHDLQIVQRNANRLLELINQLLDLSKLEAGKLELQVRKGNIQELLEIMTASFESLAKSKEINFQSSTKNLPDNAYYDEDKLQKVINNLLSNAFKFTPSGGEVNLTAEALHGNLSVRVKDTGPGLTTEQQQEIFDRFHQNEQTTKVGGTGIGLTLAKELVMLQHGTIKVESKQGEGSTFIVTLPLTEKAYKLSERDSANVTPLKSKHLTSSFSSEEEEIATHASELPIALVVEDNIDLRKHISSLLHGIYKVEQAQDGQDGIDKAIEIIPDIIVSDLMMPRVDGLELCKHLKQDKRTSHIPVILLTAKADKPSKLDGLKTGADDYLTKPFDADELMIRIKNLIDQRTKLRDKYTETLLIAPSKIQVTSPDEQFIKSALQVVEEHIADPEFTVEAFQKAIGMSRMQLHRKLKALTNSSASEFIRDLRLQRAADLLSVNGTSVADAAYASGFNNLSYFAQCFKEKYGTTPSKFEGTSTLITRSSE